MNDGLRRIQEASRELDVDLDITHLRGGVERRVARRRTQRRVAVSGISTLAVLLAVTFFGQEDTQDLAKSSAENRSSTPSEVAAQSSAQDDALAAPPPKQTKAEEGVRAPRALSKSIQAWTIAPGPNGESEAIEVETTPAGTVVTLHAGTHRLQVQTERGSEQLVVRAQRLRLSALSARLVFAYMEADRAELRVESGEVFVDDGGQRRTMKAGDRSTFDLKPAPAEAKSPAPTKWRKLAREGDHKAAYEELHRVGKQMVRDEPGDLLLSADVARLSGHPGEAIAPLSRLLDKFPTDPRAPSAAFTLGVVQFRSNPGAAANSFARCRKLQPGGPLASDALAREALARKAGGQLPQAKSLAQAYLQASPRGHQAAQMKRLVGEAE